MCCRVATNRRARLALQISTCLLMFGSVVGNMLIIRDLSWQSAQVLLCDCLLSLCASCLCC